jgi:putative lipoprotein
MSLSSWRCLLPAASLWLAACGAERPAEIPVAEIPPHARAVLFCPEMQPVEVLFREDVAVLLLVGRDVTLASFPVASGFGYAGEGYTLRGKGDEAMLQRGDDASAALACRLPGARDPWHAARLRGVAFRAVGNEPGWLVEVLPAQRLSVQLDYGVRRLALPAPAPVQKDGATVWATGGDAPVTLRARRGACTDAMSGEAFEASAELVVDGKTYTGCGRFLD